MSTDTRETHSRSLRRMCRPTLAGLAGRLRDLGVRARRPLLRKGIWPPASRNRWRFACGRGPWPDATQAVTALMRAWIVTTIATGLLSAALALAPMWDGAVFMDGLRDALNSDPQLFEPIAEARPDAPANREIPRAP